MGPPPWTTTKQSQWLTKYVREKYSVENGGLQALKTGALKDFPLAFPKVRQELANNELETEEQMEARWKQQPKRIRKWVTDRYKKILDIAPRAKTGVGSVVTPLFDPVIDEREERKKENRTRQKSAYDVAHSERSDLLPEYKGEAKQLYPNSRSKRQGHVNKCYTDFVNRDKEYWIKKAKEINEKAKRDSELEAQDTRLPRPKMLQSLDYTLDLYAKSWAKQADAIIYTVTGVMNEKKQLRVFVNSSGKDGIKAKDLEQQLSGDTIQIFKEYLRKSFPADTIESSEASALTDKAIDLTQPDEDANETAGLADADKVGSDVSDSENEDDEEVSKDTDSENEDEEDENEDKDGEEEEDGDGDAASTKDARATSVETDDVIRSKATRSRNNANSTEDTHSNDSEAETVLRTRARGKARKSQSASAASPNSIRMDDDDDEEEEEDEEDEEEDDVPEVAKAKKRGRPKKGQSVAMAAKSTDKSSKGKSKPLNRSSAAKSTDKSSKEGKTKGVKRKRKDREDDEQTGNGNSRKKSRGYVYVTEDESSSEKETQELGRGARTRARVARQNKK